MHSGSDVLCNTQPRQMFTARQQASTGSNLSLPTCHTAPRRQQYPTRAGHKQLRRQAGAALQYAQGSAQLYTCCASDVRQLGHQLLFRSVQGKPPDGLLLSSHACCCIGWYTGLCFRSLPKTLLRHSVCHSTCHSTCHSCSGNLLSCNVQLTGEALHRLHKYGILTNKTLSLTQR